MKKILFFAATALLFAACSNDEGNAPEVVQAPQAVAFDTYVPNATRAGWEGVMNTSQLQSTGFGVFAQQGSAYAAATGANFMWNQQVTYSAGSWSYNPLKYWPNETTNDSQSPAAQSTDLEGLSFFAYAPYVPTASGSTGITAISGNDATTDPTITYTVSTVPSKSVDLLWGVAPAGGLQYTAVNGKNTTTLDAAVAEGAPLLNLVKPSKDQKIKFLFKHALARIGMTVVAAVDQIAAGGTLSGTTKIAIKSVTLREVSTTKRLGTAGTLNLNNATPGTANWTVTTEGFDATIDATHELNPNLKYDTDAAGTYTQAAPWEGVTTSETDVIKDASGVTKYFMVIPTHQTTSLNVLIDYVVITKDDNVAGGYVETENVIKKTVTIPALTNNKAYNLKLILGMTSVKLDAEVADWEVDGSTEVNLPRNNE